MKPLAERRPGPARRRAVLLAALGAALAVLLLLFRAQETSRVEQLLAYLGPETEAVRIGLPSGFYEDAVTVTLEPADALPRRVELRYSLDGSDPTPDSPACSGSIRLAPRAGELTVYPLKVAVLYKGGCETVAERTYVVGAGAGTRFSLPVISIICTEEALYDPDTGIFANYSDQTDEWIRPAFLTMFRPDGGLLLERGVGLGVAGGTSAAFPVKSLRIEGGSEYDARYDELELTLLGDSAAPTAFPRITGYNHVRLRSGGQDLYDGCNLRSSLISRLAAQSRFDGCTGTQRCIVYLNGAFYGIMDLQQPYSSSYLADRYSLPENDRVETIKGSEPLIFRSAGFTGWFEADLNDPEQRAALEAQFDMDNFLLYYAIEILINNTDWPGNNFEIWRYTGAPVEGNPYTDGRWRFLLYDADLSYFTHMDEAYDRGFFEGCRDDIFVSLMEGRARGEGSVFPAVMRCDFYRNQFLTLVADLLNTSFRTRNVLSVASEEYRRIRYETEQQLGAAWSGKMDDAYRRLLLSITGREAALREALSVYLGAEERYHLTLQTSEGAAVQWCSQRLDGGSQYENDYYCGAAFPLTVQPEPGYAFAYWLVNGTACREPELLLSDALARDGALTVRAVCRRIQGGVLLLREVSARGFDDWFRLTNVGTAGVRLSEYYLSDNAAQPLQYQLPDITLAPGGSVTINGRKSAHAIGDYICNFNLKSNETLYLSDASGARLDQLTIPKMGKRETYGRDLPSGRLVFFDNRDGQRRPR